LDNRLYPIERALLSNSPFFSSPIDHTDIQNSSSPSLDPDISFSKVVDNKSLPYTGEGFVEAEVIDVNQMLFGELMTRVTEEVVIQDHDAFVSQPIRLLHQELVSKNLVLADISEYLYQHKQAQVAKGLFSQNFYTQHGSSTHGVIQDPNTGMTKEVILWCINHYTGLNRDERVMARSHEAIALFGTGAGTSPMSCGQNTLHKLLEQKIATLVGKEDALVFPTGYTTNVGVISAIASKKDFILFDRESHASIIDGIKLSGATFMSFRHNDVADLRRKMEIYSHKYVNTIVIVESAYSMSGDIAPLKEICDLKQNNHFYLYVDEAHTFGIYGEKGAGLCVQEGVVDQVDFVMSTLSKATASIGGFVACDKKYRPLIEWAANAYLFQAACSPADCAAALGALEILAEDPSVSEQIHINNAYMRTSLLEKGFDLGESQSPVIPIFIEDDQKLLKASMALLNRGVFTVAVVYPAVKKGQGRLRFIVTAKHSFAQIDQTVASIQDVFAEI